MWLWFGLILSICALFAVTANHLYLIDMRREAKALLQATAWQIKRIMGFLPISGAKEDRDRREKLIREFSLGGMHSYPDLPKIASAQALPDPKSVIDAGFQLMERNEKKTSEHIYMVATVRLGVQSFLFLVDNKNPDAARATMIELMKWQQREWEDKRTRKTINFTELKRVLGLPVTIPSEALIKSLESTSMPYRRKVALLSAVDLYYDYIFENMVIKASDGKVYQDSEVIDAMQKYAG